MSQTIDISEQQRIKRIIDCRQAGEGKASAAEYAYFVRQYSQQVLDFTSHMVTDIADAEEVAQDAFVISPMLRKWHRTPSSRPSGVSTPLRASHRSLRGCAASPITNR